MSRNVPLVTPLNDRRWESNPGRFSQNQKRIEMGRYASIAAVLALALTTPALGQQPSAIEQCRAIFRSADTNQDGVLSGKELVAAKLAEADDGPLTLEEFVAECLDQDD
jgi:hypothetical protein